MYRTAPPRPDPLLVVPGDGLRDILVGHATPSDVFGTFGGDAKVNRTPCGEIYEISYDYADEDAFLPDRAGNDARPSGFMFEYGLLKAIDVGVYQSALYTPGGVQIRSKRSAVLGAFGAADTTFTHDGRETIRYLGLGIEFTLSADDDFGVSTFVVFRKRR